MVVVGARLLSGSDYADLKLISESLCMRLGDYSKASRWTRVGKQTINRYCSTTGDNVDNYMPLDVIADLEKAAGFPVIGQYLVGLQGFSIFRNPEGDCGHRDLKQLGKMMNELSGVFDGVVKSLEDDGQISAAEINKYELIETLTKLATDVLSMKADYISKVENDE